MNDLLSHRNILSKCLTPVLAILPLFSSVAEAEQIPINAWVHDPVISRVSISPDGNKLAAITLPGLDKEPEITVWDTTDFSALPKRFRPKDSRLISASWLNNDRLFVVGRQKFDYRIGGKPTRWFRDMGYIVDSEGKRFREILKNKESVGTALFDRLPRHPDKVLVTLTNLEFAQDIYELNLDKYLAVRVHRGATGESFFANHEGVVRGKSEFKGSGDNARIDFYYKHPETNDWELHHAFYAGEREGMQPAGFDRDGRTIYMLDNTDREMTVISKYDLITRVLGDPIYGDGSFEATTILQSDQPEDFGKVIGYAGLGIGPLRTYSDPEWATIQQRIDLALPADQIHDITSISDDFSMAVIRSTGPKEPGAYHLMVGGSQLIPLGRGTPNLTPEKLADMSHVSYQSRDGLRIPGYLTIPQDGEAPYPTVIMPHGGPWARDSLRFDLWAQFLANRGYLVLQPQYRGSQGWGQSLWRAGDREWGGKMQDDKDDGAMWLVEQGLADADRIAMFGYSYGGYAAMASIVRADSPYQCAIAGAGLSELRYFDKVTFETRFGREFQNASIAGLSPLDVAKDASIPIYIFHGDRDQRVPIEQSRRYVAALKRAGKDVEYREIKDLWHSYPWWPEHVYEVLTSIEDYLANRCGPGGL